jgi:hypothetical protein
MGRAHRQIFLYGAHLQRVFGLLPDAAPILAGMDDAAYDRARSRHAGLP